MVPKLLLHAVKCACSFVDEETKAQRTRPRGTLWGGDGRTEPFIQQMHLEHSLCTSDTLAMCRAPVGPGVWVVEAIALSWVCVCVGGTHGSVRVFWKLHRWDGREGGRRRRLVQAVDSQAVAPGAGDSLLCRLSVCLCL